MKIYHTKTQEDYSALMIELEGENYTWGSGHRPTGWGEWSAYGKDTCVRVQDKLIHYSNTIFYRQCYPDIPIVEYRVKFTKENVKKIIEDYFDIYPGETPQLFSDIDALVEEAKPTVPECFDEWYKEFESTYLTDNDAKKFAIEKIYQQPLERALGQMMPYYSDLAIWIRANKLLATKAVLNGYRVEKGIGTKDGGIEMKISELITRAYLIEGVVEVKEKTSLVVFCNEDGANLAIVFKGTTGLFDTDFDGFRKLSDSSKRELAKLIYEYSLSIPSEKSEKKQEKKYSLEHKVMKGQYFTFSPSKGDFRFGGKEGTWLYQAFFTAKEWEDITKTSWEDLLVQFKAIEV